MKRILVSLAIMAAFATFSLTSCGEDSPNNLIPEPLNPDPKPLNPDTEPSNSDSEPSNPEPDPFGGVARAKFHNQKFEGAGIVFEIEPTGKHDVIKYAFRFEGKDIYHDKNLNGKKDADEKLDNNFEGFLEMPAKNNKGLFVILGDVYKLKILPEYNYENRINMSSPNYINLSNFDGSRCLTLTYLDWFRASLVEIVLNGKKNIKFLNLVNNEIKDSHILDECDNIEEVLLYANKLSGDIDLRHLKNLKRSIVLEDNKEANFILPEKSDVTAVYLSGTKTKAFNPKNYPNLAQLSVKDLSKNGMNIEEVIDNLPDRTGKDKGEIVISKEEYNKYKAKLDKKNWGTDIK